MQNPWLPPPPEEEDLLAQMRPVVEQLAPALRGFWKGVEQASARATAEISGPHWAAKQTALGNMPEPGSIPDIVGQVLAPIGQLILMAQGMGRATLPLTPHVLGRAPQLAQLAHRTGPLGREVTRDLALGSALEGWRGAVGHETDLPRILSTFAGAGVGAIGAQHLARGLSPLLMRGAVTGGAVAGAGAGLQPFVEGDAGERLAQAGPEALGVGLGTGLLTPLRQAERPRIRVQEPAASPSTAGPVTATPLFEPPTRVQPVSVKSRFLREMGPREETLSDPGGSLFTAPHQTPTAIEAREALQKAQTGRPVEIVGFRYDRGAPVEGTGRFYAVDPRYAADYAGSVPQAPTEQHLLRVDRMRFQNPLVVDGGHSELVTRLVRDDHGLPGPHIPPIQDPVRRAQLRQALRIQSRPDVGEAGYQLQDRLIAQELLERGHDGLIYRKPNAEIVDLTAALERPRPRLPRDPQPTETAPPRPETQIERAAVPGTAQSAPPTLRREMPESEAPVRIDPDNAERLAANPVEGMAQFVTRGGVPGLFKRTSEITGDQRSLPRNEFFKLPPQIREQLGEIDDQISNLNAQIARLLRRHNARTPGRLPEDALAEHEQLIGQLVEMANRRDELKPAILGALERRGDLGDVLLGRIEAERAAGVVPIELPRGAVEASAPPRPQQALLEQVRPGERAITEAEIRTVINPDELGVPEPLARDGRIAGFLTEIRAEAGQEAERVFRTPSPRHLDIIDNPDAFEAMRQSQPKLNTATFGLPRDIFGEDVVRPWRDEYRKTQVFVRQWERVLEDILQPFRSNTEARQRIGLLLEGESVANATAAEIRAAQQLRERFFGANPDSALFREFGLDANQFLTNYLPRIRRGEDITSVSMAEIPAPIRFFAELHRRGELDPRETDVLTIASAYLRSGARKKFLEPVQSALEPVAANMHPDRRRAYEAWTGLLLGRTTWDERALDATMEAVIAPLVRALRLQYPHRPAQELSRIVTQSVYLGTLGASPYSAIKNLTQQLHVIAHVGPQYWVKAHRAIRTASGKELLQYNWVGQHRVYLEGMELQRTVLDKTVGKLNDTMMGMYRWSDQQNVQTAYMAGVLKALDERKPIAVAIEEGNAAAALTQFLYGVDSPAILRTPLGRIFGVLHTYPVNFARMLYAQASSGQKARAVATVASLVLGNYVLRELSGINFRIDPRDTLKGHPAYSVLAEGRFSVPVETALSFISAVHQNILGNDPRTIQEATERFKEQLKTHIPGRVQFRRLSEFVDLAMNEWQARDEQGRVAFQATPGEGIRTLFGSPSEREERFQIRRDYENLLMRAADPDMQRRGSLLTRLGSAFEGEIPPERVAEAQREVLQRAQQLGMDFEGLHSTAMGRVRQYYYGDGSFGFWPALVAGDLERAVEFAQVLHRLGVTAQDVQSSGRGRGVDDSVVRQGTMLFGGIPGRSVPTSLPRSPRMRLPGI